MSDLDAETFECPVEGCEYTGLKNAVASHYSGKKDDAHSGGYEHAKNLLKENGPTDSTAETSDTDESGDPDPPDATKTDGGAELEFPENPDADSKNGDPSGCPDCGEEDWHDATEVLRAGDYGPEETQALHSHERVCAECGEVYA